MATPRAASSGRAPWSTRSASTEAARGLGRPSVLRQEAHRGIDRTPAFVEGQDLLRAQLHRGRQDQSVRQPDLALGPELGGPGRDVRSDRLDATQAPEATFHRTSIRLTLTVGHDESLREGDRGDPQLLLI